MASINQGDDAVERLDNAVTAFEQIMTGQEGQTVAVPGHQPQPTLAERVKQNLKPSTDEAAGYAAQASVSAKAADDAAKRASQISRLETVADAIGLAALPLPDVWAPLSDSLRLITGYGRDVLVGSDVVARMVNFSRNSTATYIGKDGQLKTAAANEPRFEKEGLLIEGQSQNIIPISNFPQNLASWSTPNPTGNLYSYVAAPDRTSSAVKVSFAGDGFNQPFPSLVVGTVYTFSFYAKNETATDVNVSIMLGSGSGEGAVRIPANTAWTRYSVTRTFQAGDSTLRWYFSTKNVEVSLWGTQLEALPFASSYIPTNGAAVTRAADVCWIPNALNVTPDYGDITIAMEVRRNLAIPPSVFPRAIHISDRQFVVADSARIMARGGGVEQVNISTAAPGTRERIAATIKGNTIACFLNGIKATLPQTPILPVSNGTSCFIGSRNGLDGLFGHVRNVRIWQRTLSDEQIKAAA
ncbi:LamG-like jellyroll fold domain-containing protein [Aeromonas sp. R6-1]|uniref:phage head spike fiber domain-containing protein n=1 Tax=Aeromonas sp. R6-1 TaxID=3138471 RepID=UPI0034A306E7